jgi:hypothetical protein
MALTYEPIFTTTLGSAAAINITSIPQTYTDLVFSAVFQGSSVSQNVRFLLNNISTSTYCWSYIIGQNGTVGFNNNNNAAEASIGNTGAGPWAGLLMDIQDYTNTEINRTIQYTLGQSGVNSSGLAITQGVWTNNTSTALTSLQFGNGTVWAAGTSVTMWGIKEV